MKFVYITVGIILLPMWLRLMYRLKMRDIARREKRDELTELHLGR